MRFALLPVLMLAIPLLSGCAGLVEEDPNAVAAALADEAEAYADEAEQAVENLPGHIAGTVVDAALVPIAGATVRLVALDLVRTTDADGSFAFVDLAQGTYLVEAEAEGFLAGNGTVDVRPGVFVRPSLALQAIPAPEPYSEVMKFEGYADVGALFIGFGGCYCWFEFPVAEGVQELVIEAVLDDSNDPFSSNWLSWQLSTYDEASEDSNYFGGQEASPLFVSLPSEELGPVTDAYVEIMPNGDLLPSFARTFTAYASVFYHAPAPEGYTALEE